MTREGKTIRVPDVGKTIHVKQDDRLRGERWLPAEVVFSNEMRIGVRFESGKLQSIRNSYHSWRAAL